MVRTDHSDDFGTCFKCRLKRLPIKAQLLTGVKGTWGFLEGIKKKVFTRIKLDGFIISKSEQEKNFSIVRISGERGHSWGLAS